MSALILDAEAMSRLARARGGVAPGSVIAALRAAVEEGADVLVPAAVLAELYRGGAHDQVLDSCLGRNTGIEVRNTTRALARQVGHLLARAGRGSELHVDATVVAVALTAGDAVVVTGDPVDMMSLAGGMRRIRVEAL